MFRESKIWNLRPYFSQAGNELILKLTKNMASGVIATDFFPFSLLSFAVL